MAGLDILDSEDKNPAVIIDRLTIRVAGVVYILGVIANSASIDSHSFVNGEQKGMVTRH